MALLLPLRVFVRARSWKPGNRCLLAGCLVVISSGWLLQVLLLVSPWLASADRGRDGCAVAR